MEFTVQDPGDLQRRRDFQRECDPPPTPPCQGGGCYRLVIEVDRAVHAMQEEYDTVRTERLEEWGYRVICFTNDEVHRQLSAVLEAITTACEEEQAASPPTRGRG